MKKHFIREAARDQYCTIRSPRCKGRRDTVVLCHMRMYGTGGTSLKPSDSCAAFGCHECNQWTDGGGFDKSDPLDWLIVGRAMAESHEILWGMRGVDIAPFLEALQEKAA